MIKLKVEKIDGFMYHLKDNCDKVYEASLEFFNDIKVDIGDFIYVNEKLINKLNHEMLCFGVLDSIYGKDIQNENDEDLIILKKANEQIYLKRYYG